MPVLRSGVRGRWRWRELFLFCLIVGMTTMPACGGGDDSPTPAPAPAPPGNGGGGGGTFNQGRGFNGIVRSIVPAGDDSRDIYVGGDFTEYNGTAANRLIRLRQDGTVANAFGQGFDGPVSLALARAGGDELYASGAFTQFNGQPVPPIIRLTRNGDLDAGFRLTADFAPSRIAPAEDGSGDLYAVFTTRNSVNENNVFQFHIARLNPDGSVDPSFSTGSGFPGGSAARGNPVSIAALVPLPNGTLYVGGSLLSYNGVNVSSLVRLNPDGTLDSAFMPNVGYIVGANVVEAMVPARDGTQDVYVGGRIRQYNGMPVNNTIRITQTGALDTSFAPTLNLVPLVIAPAQDQTGDVFLTGFVPGPAATLPRFVRLDRHGAPVPTFREPILDGDIVTIAPARDGTKDIYIGGLFTTYNGSVVNHFARIHGDGALASTVAAVP